MDVVDLYRILQVDPFAELVVIQAAYHALARRFHPDGTDPNTGLMAELNRAYATLKDPEQRRRYDAARSMRRTHAVPVTNEPAAGRVNPWSQRRGPDDSVILDFGRYAGWRLSDLARHDPDYLRWLCRHSSGIRFREAISRLLPPEPDLQRRANSVA